MSTKLVITRLWLEFLCLSHWSLVMHCCPYSDMHVIEKQAVYRAEEGLSIRVTLIKFPACACSPVYSPFGKWIGVNWPFIRYAQQTWVFKLQEPDRLTSFNQVKTITAGNMYEMLHCTIHIFYSSSLWGITFWLFPSGRGWSLGWNTICGLLC